MRGSLDQMELSIIDFSGFRKARSIDLPLPSVCSAVSKHLYRRFDTWN
jgi:hypothetical protein